MIAGEARVNIAVFYIFVSCHITARWIQRGEHTNPHSREKLQVQTSASPNTLWHEKRGDKSRTTLVKYEMVRSWDVLMGVVVTAAADVVHTYASFGKQKVNSRFSMQKKPPTKYSSWHLHITHARKIHQIKQIQRVSQILSILFYLNKFA